MVFRADIFSLATFCIRSADTAHVTENQYLEDSSPEAVNAVLSSLKLISGKSNSFPRLFIRPKFSHLGWPHHLTVHWLPEFIMHHLWDSWISECY